jgi:hypothetical protein
MMFQETEVIFKNLLSVIFGFRFVSLLSSIRILASLNQCYFPAACGPHLTQIRILSTECFDMLPAVSTKMVTICLNT